MTVEAHGRVVEQAERSLRTDCRWSSSYADIVFLGRLQRHNDELSELILELHRCAIIVAE